MKIGGKYNWKNQTERLVFIGRNWSGNGYWNQFEKVDEPGIVWCEVPDSDLHMLEETKEEEAVSPSSANEVQWRNIKKVVNALADLCFGSPEHPQWGVAHVALTTSLTSKDGLQIELEPLPKD